jgi:DNA-directed RNA polymerase specialized sigma24 family protein
MAPNTVDTETTLDARLTDLRQTLVRRGRRTGSSFADADDDASETLARVWAVHQREGGTCMRHFDSWYVNRAFQAVQIDKVRRTAGRGKKAKPQLLPLTGQEQHLCIEPADIIATSELLQHLHSQLNTGSSELLALVLDGHTAKDISRMFGTSMKATHARLDRMRIAVSRLRRAFSQPRDGGVPLSVSTSSRRSRLNT